MKKENPESFIVTHNFFSFFTADLNNFSFFILTCKQKHEDMSCSTEYFPLVIKVTFHELIDF